MSNSWKVSIIVVLSLLAVLVVGNFIYSKLKIERAVVKNSQAINGHVELDDEGNKINVPGILDWQKSQEEINSDVEKRVASLQTWKENAYKKLKKFGYDSFEGFVKYSDSAAEFIYKKFVPALKKHGFKDWSGNVDVAGFVKTVKDNKGFIDTHAECIEGICEKWNKKNKKNSTTSSSGGGESSSGLGGSKHEQPQLIIEMGAEDSALQKVVDGEVVYEVPLEVEWVD